MSPFPRGKSQGEVKQMNEELLDIPTHAVADRPLPVNEILLQRGGVHGSFADNASILQSFLANATHWGNWENLTEVEKTALWLILHKIARILSGNPHFDDHWADIAGYAELVRKDNIEHLRA
jgi:hypothetical protein